MIMDVLILDDNKYLQETWRADFASCNVPFAYLIKVISAFSVDDAIEQFGANPNLAAIVVSGCITGRQPSTIPFVKEVRKTSNVPIVATSTNSWYQKELMKAGCSHETSKDDLPRKVLEVLGLIKPPS